MSRIIFIVFSILLFIYMIWPQPLKIADFKPLPNSFKSTLDGDTVQVPNVSAYFSNNYREFALRFYKDNYQGAVKLPFSPYRLNYPPEYSFIAIKKHTDTTYLEELVYPLKGSLFVNGFEPYYENGEPKYWGSSKFAIGESVFDTKVTLRLFPSPFWARFIVFLGIIASIIMLKKLFLKIVFNKRLLRNL